MQVAAMIEVATFSNVPCGCGAVKVAEQVQWVMRHPHNDVRIELVRSVERIDDLPLTDQ
ncbi:MAG: hypothetical protein GAKPKEKM_03126 [Rhodocyclaceae bacterium]|nr:hypothetical protein [Rhodocyclaceae bacterium]